VATDLANLFERAGSYAGKILKAPRRPGTYRQSNLWLRDSKNARSRDQRHNMAYSCARRVRTKDEAGARANS
jgi:hypothetical protein